MNENHSKYGKLAMIALLGAVFFIPFFSAQNFSPANDEVTHLPSGYSYWRTGEITLNPQHPPLVKLAASFPLLFMDLNFEGGDPNLAGPLKNEWKFGSNFLFSNNADRLMLWGRLPVMLLSVLLALYIYKWASEMFRTTETQNKLEAQKNHKAGLIALFLYAFTPNIIAHAQFVTTDLALASFSFIAFYYLWKFWKSSLKRYIIFSGLFLGFALGSKFSTVVFIPLITFFVFVHVWRHPDLSNLNLRIRRFLSLTLLMAIPAFVVLYFSYLMPTDLGFYLKGLKTVYADWKPDFKFYLNGQFLPDGRWYYFLEAFLIKTPIPILITFITAILFYKKLRINAADKAFIFLPMLFFALVTVMKAHNVGIRYLIPAFPFLILYVGGLAVPLEASFAAKLRVPLKSSNKTIMPLLAVSLENLHSLTGRVQRTLARLLMVGLASWLVFSSASIYPDYLAYFNELVGGSKNGYKYLDDSNIEWGQDLKRMKEYQVKNPDTKIIYSWKYSNPLHYGINNSFLADDSGWWRDPKGQYAVNTFLLIRMQLLSGQRKDPSLNWLALYKPVDRVGYSFFVYKFE